MLFGAIVLLPVRVGRYGAVTVGLQGAFGQIANHHVYGSRHSKRSFWQLAARPVGWAGEPLAIFFYDGGFEHDRVRLPADFSRRAMRQADD